MTQSLLFSNNAVSTLAAPLSASSTTATLAAGTGELFTSPGAGQVQVVTITDAATGLINEIVWITARAGDVVTLMRGQEGTAALAWNAGDSFAQKITAGQLEVFQAAAPNIRVSATTLTPGSSASVTSTQSGGITEITFGIPQGEPGINGTGTVGPAPTFTSVEAFPLAAGAQPEAAVTQSGGNVQLVFGIPAGQPGTTPSVEAGQTTTLQPGAQASVGASTAGGVTTFSFGIPQGTPGPAPTVQAGQTTTLAPGQSASVSSATSGGTTTLTFDIPSGLPAVVQAGTTTTLSPGQNASVSSATSGGTTTLNFSVPQGPVGPAPVIQAGGATTLTPGSSATVTATTLNGTTTLTFGVPQGATGGPGQTAAMGTPIGAWTPNTSPVLASGGLLNGTLAVAGSLLTIGGSTGGTTTLGTAIDGLTSFVQGDQLYQAGAQWIYIQRTANGIFSQLSLPDQSIFEDGSGVPGFVYSEGPDVGFKFDWTNGFQTSVATITALTATTFNGPAPTVLDAGGLTMFSSNVALGQVVGPDQTEEFGLTGHDLVAGSDRRAGFHYDGTTGNLAISGNLYLPYGSVISSGSTPTTGFQATDIEAAEQRVVAQNAQDSAPFYGAQPLNATNYAFILSLGPSENLGSEAIPALPMPAWPSGNLMIGGSTRCQDTNINSPHVGTFTPIGGSSAFSALAATNTTATNTNGSIVGSLVTIPTGTVTVSNATISVLSAGTISLTGTFSPAPNTVFSAGQFAFIGGATGATANNYNAPGVTNESNYFTISAASSSALTLTAHGTYAATSAPEAGLLLTQYTEPYVYLGEDPITTAVTDLRAAQLLSNGLASDANHQNVVVNAGVGNQTLSQWLPAASPSLFPMLTGSANLAKSNAGTKTIATPALVTLFGGPEYTAGLTKAVVKANALTLYNDYVSSVATGIFGQTLPPWWFLNVRAGSNTADYDGTASVATTYDPMPVANAVLEICGMGTARGVAASTPLAVCVGNSIMGLAHSQHFDPNGAITYGAQVGKAMIKAMLANGTPLWRKPPWVTQALIRGNQILCSVAGLRGQLVNRDVFNLCILQTISNSGISVTDSTIPVTLQSGNYGFWGGGLPIASVQIVGPDTFLVTLVAAPTGSNLLLWVADQSVHGGLTSLADSDPSTSQRVWQYTAGSGQSPWDNQPAPSGISLSQPFQNGALINTPQCVQPCAIPIIAG